MTATITPARLRDSIASIPPGGFRCIDSVYVRRSMDGLFALGGDGSPVLSGVTLEEACEILLSPRLQGVIR